MLTSFFRYHLHFLLVSLRYDVIIYMFEYVLIRMGLING